MGAVDEASNPEDCATIYIIEKAEAVQSKNGIYAIYPEQGKSFKVYCDMTTDGGGWIVIQRRGDYPKQQNFYRSWKDYKEGFGSFQRDFWLGNDKISILTNQNVCNLRFDLEDFDGEKRFAVYSGFTEDDESHKYKMTFDSFLKGDAGDSFTYEKNKPFSSKDQNNVGIVAQGECAKVFKGAWWYADCHESNLNGLYLHGDRPNQWTQGVNWKKFRGYTISMRKAEMKIRPASFKSEL